MKRKFTINSPEAMIQLGQQIGVQAFENMLITLHGDLGAGKTMLSKGIAKGLDITDVVNSPTFTIMKIYQGKYTLYHMDVYRLNDASDDFDLEEYFEQDGVSIVEWAENISEILPSEFLNIEIIRLSDTSRNVEITSNSTKYDLVLEGITI